MSNATNGSGRRSAGSHFREPGAPSPAPAPIPRQAPQPGQAPVVAPHATTGATSQYQMGVAHGDVSGVAQASQDAPRPVDPSATSSFSTITGGQGAVIADRGNAADAADAARSHLRGGRRGSRRSKRLSASARRNVSSREVAYEHTPRRDRKAFAILGVAALLVVVLVAVLVTRAINSTADAPAPSTRVERTEAGADQSLTYDGYTYKVQQAADGTHEFVRVAADGSDPLTLCKLSGTPVAIVLCDGAYCIPENLSDGTWDVVVYTMGDGSMATKLVGQDGSEVTGQGKLASAKLDGTNLVLTDEAGAQTTVPLA